MFKKLNITCNEAAIICDKSQYKESSFFEKIKLNWHIFTCKICSLYVKQNKKMTMLFRMKSIDCKKEIQCLSDTDKKLLKKELEKIKV